MVGELTNNKYKRISLILSLLLVILCSIENSFLGSWLGNTAFNFEIKPVGFLIVACLLRYKIPKIHLEGKVYHKTTLYVWAFNCSVIYIVINILGGFIQGFGKSPYSHTLIGIGTNVFLVGSVLVGRESIRAYIVSSFMRRHNKWALISIILLMTATELRLSDLTALSDIKSGVIFCASSLLPKLCGNILATYLVFYGGPVASVIYLGMLEAAMWLSPILPAMNWLGKGVVGILVPLFCLLYITDTYLKITKVVKSYREKKENLWEWILGTVGSVIFIWFVVGVFSVYPSAIATGSMEPMIRPGDVILIEKIKDMEGIEALEVGDIIQFKRGNILITHRIIEVLQEGGLPSYRTKGDNNSAEDRDLVKAEDVKGILKRVIPKVGWPTLIFKSNNPDILDEVKF